MMNFSYCPILGFQYFFDPIISGRELRRERRKKQRRK